MTRNAVFANIRSALGETGAQDRARAVAARRAQPPHHPLPAFAQEEGAERVERFVRCLQTQGGADVLTGHGLAGLPDAIAAVAASLGSVPSLVIGDDERLAALDWPGDLRPKRWTRDQSLGDGTAAVSHAWGAVAETGTLLLASGAANPASLAFLPEVHIVAVARNTIAPSFEEAFARLGSDLSPQRWPRAVNLVSGASRTGDIGGRIVKGAHGPRRLAVFIYGE
ncbi:LutC/YkgG family protein [Hyphomicrobium sp.]|uniref:LutC/YkgG family protein n=1 Tax=Hyphomicrobium sp. TaxID=82 RepID=UPI003F71C993